ncbi:hemolysin [Elizabethkingia argenteiflava]|uniref:hemolysin n=1 Tax=Elizabethkingia argenteiflava TaxID=2681556 RepID=UPI00159C683F|nr:hemolysin [Elizabethkingia argenteiflava]
MKKKLFLLLAWVLLLFNLACSREGPQGENIISKDQQAGRFDNIPFSWDVSNGDSHDIFIGDYSYNPLSTEQNKVVLASNIRINSLSVYPGAVYPLKNIQNFTFDAEVRYPKKPYDLIFSFSDPYVIEDIDNEKGFTIYSTKLSQAVNSRNFNNYINSGVKKQVDYSATECFTYSDVQKAFSFNAGLGALFTANMSQNSQNKKYKTIYLARLIGTSFDVVFESNIHGFFKSDEYNQDAKKFKGNPDGGRRDGSTVGRFFSSNPYYTKQVSYGKYAYLAIQSEYQYSKIKTAIEATFNIWKISGGGKYTKEATDILSKSVVTVLTTGDKSTEPFWGTSLENLYSIFNIKYDRNFYGFPVYAQMRTVAGDELYQIREEIPKSGSGDNGFENERNRNGGSGGGSGGGRR